MIKYLIIILFIATSLSANAQNGKTPSRKLIHKEALLAFLPEEIGKYKFHQVANPPIYSIPPKSSIVNALYLAGRESSFFLQFIHYRLPDYRNETSFTNWKHDLSNNGATKSSYKGHTAYMRTEPAKVSIYIGENFEVAAYSVRGKGNIDILKAAIDAIDFPGLINMIEEYNSEKPEEEAVEPMGNNQNIPAENVAYGDIDCDSFNSDFRKKMKKEFGIKKLMPWVHLLKGEQSSTAEIKDEVLSFPKEGNDWLQCVNINDILWSPWDMPMFIKRIKGITDQPDSVLFTTENSGLDEVIGQGKMEVKSGDN